jgi:predicted DNA binding CopG/RHH family protein
MKPLKAKTDREVMEHYDSQTITETDLTRAMSTAGIQAIAQAKKSQKVPSRLTSIRLEPDLEQRLRSLASAKGIGYQTLLKNFVIERIYEEEKRNNVFGGH